MAYPSNVRTVWWVKALMAWHGYGDGHFTVMYSRWHAINSDKSHLPLTKGWISLGPGQMKKCSTTDIWVLNSHHSWWFLATVNTGESFQLHHYHSKTVFPGCCRCHAHTCRRDHFLAAMGEFFTSEWAQLWAMAEARKVKCIGWPYEDQIPVKGAEVKQQGLVGCIMACGCGDALCHAGWHQGGH